VNFKKGGFRMKLGMRAHDLGRMAPLQLATALRSHEFETAQLAIPKAISGVSNVYDVSPALLEEVRKSFEDVSVEIGVLGCYCEIGLTDKDARMAEVEKFLCGIEHAKHVNAKLIGTETTNFPPQDDHLREKAYLGLRESVLRICDKAERLGVNVGIETVAEHTLNGPQITARLLEEVGSDRLKVIFDPVNLILTRQDIEQQSDIFEDFINTLGEHIAALHIKDITLEDGQKVWQNIGKGEIDYTHIFEWARAKAKPYPILREEVKPESVQTDIRQMLRYMRGDGKHRN